MGRLNKILHIVCVAVMFAGSLALFFGQTLTNTLNPFGAAFTIGMLIASGWMAIRTRWDLKNGNF